MDSFMSPDDVEDLFRPLTPAERNVTVGLISYAESLLDLDAAGWRDKAGASPAVAAYIRAEIAFAIKRVLSNPDFTRQVSTTVDDGTVSRTLDTAVSAGLLYFPDGVLERIRGRRRRGAFSIRPGW